MRYFYALPWIGLLAWIHAAAGSPPIETLKRTLLIGELGTIEIPLPPNSHRQLRVVNLPVESVELLQTYSGLIAGQAEPVSCPYWRFPLPVVATTRTTLYYDVPATSSGGTMVVRLRPSAARSYLNGLCAVYNGSSIKSLVRVQVTVANAQHPAALTAPPLTLCGYEYADADVPHPESLPVTRQRLAEYGKTRFWNAAYGNSQNLKLADWLQRWITQRRPNCAQYIIAFPWPLPFEADHNEAAGVVFFQTIADRIKAAGQDPSRFYFCPLDEAWYGMSADPVQRATWINNVLHKAGLKTFGHVLFFNELTLGPQIYRDYLNSLDLFVESGSRASRNDSEAPCDDYADAYYAELAKTRERGIYHCGGTLNPNLNACRYLFWTTWLRGASWLGFYQLGGQGDNPDDPAHWTVANYSPVFWRADGTRVETAVSLEIERGQQDFALFHAAQQRCTPQELEALRACVKATYWGKSAADIAKSDPQPAIDLARSFLTRDQGLAQVRGLVRSR